MSKDVIAQALGQLGLFQIKEEEMVPWDEFLQYWERRGVIHLNEH